jgi:hypothetical protein
VNLLHGLVVQQRETNALIARVVVVASHNGHAKQDARGMRLGLGKVRSSLALTAVDL